MKFKLQRLEISDELISLSSKTIKRRKIYLPRMSKKNLMEMGAVCREIGIVGLPNHLVVRKLQGKLGFGVFLHPEAKPILRGEVIAPYAGEVIVAPQNIGDNSDYVFSLISRIRLSRAEQRMFDPKSSFHPRRLYSLDLDAGKKGNFTRFINHSTKPNVEAHLLKVPRNSVGPAPSLFEMVYIAKKKIRPGEQLLVCYEGDDRSYWGALQIKPFPMTPQTFQVVGLKGKVVHSV